MHDLGWGASFPWIWYGKRLSLPRSLVEKLPVYGAWQNHQTNHEKRKVKIRNGKRRYCTTAVCWTALDRHVLRCFASQGYSAHCSGRFMHVLVVVLLSWLLLLLLLPLLLLLLLLLLLFLLLLLLLVFVALVLCLYCCAYFLSLVIMVWLSVLWWAECADGDKNSL